MKSIFKAIILVALLITTNVTFAYDLGRKIVKACTKSLPAYEFDQSDIEEWNKGDIRANGMDGSQIVMFYQYNSHFATCTYRYMDEPNIPVFTQCVTREGAGVTIENCNNK